MFVCPHVCAQNATVQAEPQFDAATYWRDPSTQMTLYPLLAKLALTLRSKPRIATALFFSFLPRDAMLARYMLSSCVRLSVRLSVTRRYCTN